MVRRTSARGSGIGEQATDGAARQTTCPLLYTSNARRVLVRTARTRRHVRAAVTGIRRGGTDYDVSARINLSQERAMHFLLWIAILLIVLWVVARVVGFVAGALLNVLWIVALVLLVIWLFSLVTGRRRV
jgi:hypothetical protein